MGRRRWVAPCRGQLNILSHRSNGGIHISARPLCWPATISLRNIIIFHIRGNGKFSTRIFLRTFVSLLLFLLLLVQVAVWTVSPTLLNREQYQVAIIKKEVKERTVTKHFFFYTRTCIITGQKPHDRSAIVRTFFSHLCTLIAEKFQTRDSFFSFPFSSFLHELLHSKMRKRWKAYRLRPRKRRRESGASRKYFCPFSLFLSSSLSLDSHKKCMEKYIRGLKFPCERRPNEGIKDVEGCLRLPFFLISFLPLILRIGTGRRP